MPLGFLGTLWRWMKQSLVDVEFVISLMNTQEFIEELEHPEECKIKTGGIVFDNVNFTYDTRLAEEDQVNILKNLSFTIDAGSSVGIVG